MVKVKKNQHKTIREFCQQQPVEGHLKNLTETDRDYSGLCSKTLKDMIYLSIVFIVVLLSHKIKNTFQYI